MLTSGKYKEIEVHAALNSIELLRNKFASDQYANLWVNLEEKWNAKWNKPIYFFVNYSEIS